MLVNRLSGERCSQLIFSEAALWEQEGLLFQPFMMQTFFLLRGSKKANEAYGNNAGAGEVLYRVAVLFRDRVSGA